MGMPTFGNILTIGHVQAENELYKHYHYPEMLIRYDSNFIAFKRMPSIHEFKETEEFLKAFHLVHNQSHLKFEFPDNEKPDEGLCQYFKDSGYDVGWLELYFIRPHDFLGSGKHAAITVSEVTERNLNDFIDLQYETDKQMGKPLPRGKWI